MTTAGNIAIELRKIADSLERDPTASISRPTLSFYEDDKDSFMALSRLLPKPLDKEPGETRYEIGHRGKGVWYRAIIDRNKVCKLVTPAVPAVYDCAPLLSQEEEDSLA